MKIVILDAYTANPGDLSWKELEGLGDLTVYERTPITDETEIRMRIADADIVLTNKTPLSAKTIVSAEKLKYIGVLATGYNIVDTAAAKSRGIPVTNIPAYSTAATAQLAIALLLEICHHVGHHSDAVHNGRWESSEDFAFWDYPLMELAGKTFGVIGFGRIGQTTARIAHALGMKILAFVRSPKTVDFPVEYVSLDELYARSDVLSLHCPQTPETMGLINRESLAKMKTGAILLNNARGGVIVERDVADALNSGKLYAAGVDVASTEPISGDNPLLSAKNCIITPHISWAPKESRMRLLNMVAGNVRAFLEGNPVNVVNL